MGARRRARILAFQSVFPIGFTEDNKILDIDFFWLDEVKREKTKEDIIVFARLIIQGVQENIDLIDEKIKKNIDKWDFSRLSKVDLSILRISVYSLCFQKDIPASVTIDEAIHIAKEYSSDESYKFINGVLDSINKSLK